MKLKTLKDLQETDYSTSKEDIGLVNAVFYDLKKEAIKQVNHFDKKFSDSLITQQFYVDQQAWWNKRAWIIDFFNLEEEDLK